MAKVVKTSITDEKKIKEILEKEGYFNIFKWCDSEGTKYPEHTHPHYEVRWILSGHLQIIENGKTIDLFPGDRMESVANTPHSAYVPKDVCYICASR
ncbi:cupin domain-containing protein [Hydrogenimonas thermophila]|uniref:Cupin domain-containing protein n=1 Tax=Hydrogenimonas thermophila TaxID=223786 RepID=A0A1I5PWD0_9BACT|nr:cupin domain-containing protein [Hydrogenimonas thermophila]SFP38403.1 Cupin domain-containing protein [Hydrogenimonas thermophila]